MFQSGEELSELTEELTLLTNILGGCRKAKELATELGLADTLHKLWSWVATDLALLTVLLRTLVTFTANCPLGKTSSLLESLCIA